MLKTPQKPFPQCLEIPTGVLLKGPGISPSVDDLAEVGKIEELVDTRSDRIRHVNFSCGRLLARFNEKTVEIACYAYCCAQVPSDIRVIK